jgi:NAD(P)-dependent dehydrogenase (short-subunit alcohol dehydrogenase family)
VNLNLHGKTALVSGSTAGIGLAVASGLAAEGARVILTGRTQLRADAAAATIRGEHPKARVVPFAADLASAAGAARLAKAEPEVDVLVNNLGIFEPKPFEEIGDNEWLRFFEVNVLSGIRLARAYLPFMREQNWGRIVFISSESAINIPVEMVHYGMTKTAQLAVSRGIAEGLAGTGVTCNAVLPGPTRSEGVATFVKALAKERGLSEMQMEEEFFRSGRPSSLLKRFATVEEVANMVVYVCSPAASATNGAALRVDGGVVRSIT